MNTFVQGAFAVGTVLVLGSALSACNRNASAQGPQYATVLSATPIRTTVNHPQRACRMQTVTHHKPVKDRHQIAGTAIGALVGGLAGHQVGGGRGKTLATLAGAVAGGYAGKKIEERHQQDSTYTTQQQQCQTINHRSSRIVGYTVRYRLPDGTVQTARMDHDPGSRVEIKQSTTVVSGAN